MNRINEDEEAELPFVKYLKWLSILVGCFAILLILDYLLPVGCSNHRVTEKKFFKQSNRFGSIDYDMRIITDEFGFKAKPELFAAVEEYSEISVCRTPIFKAVKSVMGVHVDNGSQFNFEAILPVYRGFAAFPISLLLASAFSVFYKKDEIVAYCFGIISIIIFIVILLIM